MNSAIIMPEWNPENRIHIKDIEKLESPETSENEDTINKIYDEDARYFIKSIENDPEFGKLNEKEIIELENEVKEVSQKYKEKEQGIVAKRLGVIKKIIKEFVVVALILVGYDISTSLLKPKINLMYNAVKLVETIKYEIEFDKEDKEIISFLREKISQNEVDRICDLKNNEDGKDREKERIERKIPLLENMEGLGVSQGDMKLILKTFPNSFVTNINKIQYKAEDGKIPEDYGIKGSPAAKSNIILKEVTIFESEKKFMESMKNYDELFHIIAHEMAHLNDWRINSILSIKDRLSLCKAIIERVESKDCYNSYYVKSISNKDKKIELSLKALEYFAIICNRYFNSPGLLPNKDKKIIEEMIKKTDPEFSQNKNKKDAERFTIIERMNDNKFYK